MVLEMASAAALGVLTFGMRANEGCTAGMNPGGCGCSIKHRSGYILHPYSPPLKPAPPPLPTAVAVSFSSKAKGTIDHDKTICPILTF